MDKVAVFVIYDRAIDEEVLSALGECGIGTYTRWHNASGVGSTGPHQGDNVWPALNNVLMAVIDSQGQQGEQRQQGRQPTAEAREQSHAYTMSSTGTTIARRPV